MKTISSTDLVFDKKTRIFQGLLSLLATKELITVDDKDFLTIEVLNPIIRITNPDFRTNFDFKFSANHERCYEYEIVSSSKKLEGIRLRLYK